MSSPSSSPHLLCPNPLPPPPPPICLLNIPTPSLPSPPLPSPPLHSWRSWWRGGAARALLFLRTVLLVQNTDGYYGAAHKLIMLEINCCCQRQPPTCPTVSLCPLMHRIQLMDQMFAQCAAPFKVSTKVACGGGGASDLHLFVFVAHALLCCKVLIQMSFRKIKSSAAGPSFTVFLLGRWQLLILWEDPAKLFTRG